MRPWAPTQDRSSSKSPPNHRRETLHRASSPRSAEKGSSGPIVVLHPRPPLRLETTVWPFLDQRWAWRRQARSECAASRGPPPALSSSTTCSEGSSGGTPAPVTPPVDGKASSSSRRATGRSAKGPRARAYNLVTRLLAAPLAATAGAGGGFFA